MSQTTLKQEELIALTSDIVGAHVSRNRVAIDDVPGLIGSVYAALSGLGTTPVVEEVRPAPAVSIRASVRPDHVTCLECGTKLKMLKRHLTTDHGLSVQEYRQRWGLSADHPLVAPDYAARRRDLAKQIGLGRKPGKVAKVTPAGKDAAKSKPKAKPGRRLALRSERIPECPGKTHQVISELDDKNGR